MKKSVIMKLGVVVLAAVLFSGCQTGATDEELISCTMGKWKEALIAQDLDKLMEMYSEDYESMQGGDKEATREFMEGIFEQGYLDNAEVDLEKAETKIEGNEAGVTGVELMLDQGPMMLDVYLQKEEKAWLIVDLETNE